MVVWHNICLSKYRTEVFKKKYFYWLIVYWEGTWFTAFKCIIIYMVNCCAAFTPTPYVSISCGRLHVKSMVEYIRGPSKSLRCILYVGSVRFTCISYGNVEVQQAKLTVVMSLNLSWMKRDSSENIFNTGKIEKKKS